RLEVLEVMAQINLLEARWKVANGIAELSQEVCRHLVKQHWRNEGALDLLIRCFTSPSQMERLYQMHVIPDVLPGLQPIVDL
ncbi:hypothetical protein EDB85DRAFT_1819990, partial [Lactarius pseudohatsudake]